MALSLFRDPFFSHTLANPDDSNSHILGALDVSETESQHVIHVDTPGLTSEDVKVQIKDGNLLTISGKREKKSEEHDEKRHYHRVERSYGSFQRAFRLPENADVQSVEAHVDDGVLTVTVNKVADPTPRLTDVKVGSKKK
eukprot:m.47813 g.47813  ORF g.47813 m.47813 type:complete len:140 (+) comp17702_c0_seq1:253-672(+)